MTPHYGRITDFEVIDVRVWAKERGENPRSAERRLRKLGVPLVRTGKGCLEFSGYCYRMSVERAAAKGLDFDDDCDTTTREDEQ